MADNQTPHPHGDPPQRVSVRDMRRKHWLWFYKSDIAAAADACHTYNPGAARGDDRRTVSPSTCVAVYAILAGAADSTTGTGWINLASIGETLHCSVDSARRAINALINAGMIQKRGRKGPDGRQLANEYALLDLVDLSLIHI